MPTFFIGCKVPLKGRFVPFSVLALEGRTGVTIRRGVDIANIQRPFVPKIGIIWIVNDGQLMGVIVVGAAKVEG